MTSPFSYAYPGVWDGQFWGCAWVMGECPFPMEGDDCWLYTCKGSEVHCPSSCKSGPAVGIPACTSLTHPRTHPNLVNNHDV